MEHKNMNTSTAMAMSMSVPMVSNIKKRKLPPSSTSSGLGELHEDMLERVLARLPPASYFRLRAVCRRWRAAAASPTFRRACSQVPSRDPLFLMVSDDDHQEHPVAFDAAERNWTPLRRMTAQCHGKIPMPVASSGGLVCYRVPSTGELAVANPVTGASRALPPLPEAAAARALHAIAMYGSPYRVALVLGELPELSMVAFDSCKNSWEEEVSLVRKSDTSSPDMQMPGDETVYFLSKAGDVVATNMQRSPSKQYSSVVAFEHGEPVAYFLSHSGTVVACNLAKRTFAELPRILPVYYEYSIDVVACNDRAAYVVVLSEFLETASLRVWQFAEGSWRQVAAMPPAMSHDFYSKKADINCVGHGDCVLVCVNSGDVNACFMCNVRTNQWEELPKCCDGNGEAKEFLAAFAFEPRLEVVV